MGRSSSFARSKVVIVKLPPAGKPKISILLASLVFSSSRYTATASSSECKKAFAKAWGRLLNETSAERLERAWELERAVQARQQRMGTTKKDDA